MRRCLLHARRYDFDFSDVLGEVASKLIRRHPHIVFQKNWRYPGAPRCYTNTSQA